MGYVIIHSVNFFKWPFINKTPAVIVLCDGRDGYDPSVEGIQGKLDAGNMADNPSAPGQQGSFNFNFMKGRISMIALPPTSICMYMRPDW